MSVKKLNCPTCGIEFIQDNNRQKYCSKHCRLKDWNLKQKEKKNVYSQEFKIIKNVNILPKEFWDAFINGNYFITMEPLSSNINFFRKYSRFISGSKSPSASIFSINCLNCCIASSSVVRISGLAL